MTKGASRVCDGYDITVDPRTILPTLPRALLERIIKERLDEGDEELAKLIFSVGAEKKDMRTPQAIVSRLLKSYDRGEYGCIEDPYGFALDLRRLAGRAAEAASSGNYGFAVALLTRLIESAAPHTYEGGDEDCEIMESVGGCLEHLAEIARAQQAGTEALGELRSWALQCIDAKWAQEGDSWDMSCLEIAALAARSESDMRVILNICTRFAEKQNPEWSEAYRAERASTIAASLLDRLGDDAERSAYIEEHLHFADIRNLAIDEAMAARDFDRAIELCRDGIALFYQKNKRGTADELAERLVAALDAAGKNAEAAMEAESLLIESFSNERYMSLKKRHPQKESWIAVRDRIIGALEKSGSTYQLAEIYKIERMPDRLLSIVEKNAFLFHKHLATIGRVYPERAADFLKGDVERKLRDTASRESYAHRAEDVLDYAKYAGKKAAEALFDSLIAAYPARRAMREEFERARKSIGGGHAS
jgi:hypothetical protein